MKIKQIGIILIILIVGVSVSSAYSINGPVISEDFESYNEGTFDGVASACTGHANFVYEGTFGNYDFYCENDNGNYADLISYGDSQKLELHVGNDAEMGIYAETNDTITVDESKNTTFEFDINVTNPPNTGGQVRTYITDRSDSVYVNIDDSNQIRFTGSIINNVNNGSINTGQLTTFKIILDYDNSRAYLYNGSTQLANTSITGSWDNPDSVRYRMYMRTQFSSSGSITAHWDNLELRGDEVIESLSLSPDDFVEANTLTPYEVTLESTNIETQVTTQTDVTDEATLTSYNTTLLQVNEDEQHFISGTGSGYVIVNVTHNGVSRNETLFVGNKSIQNIEDLPPEQYIPAALGFGDTQSTSFGMGSEVQWVFLAILIGSMASWKARNEYIGIGVIIALIILFWINDSVSLGITLVALFYGIFIGYLQQQIPSRSDTNVGGFQ